MGPGFESPHLHQSPRFGGATCACDVCRTDLGNPPGDPPSQWGCSPIAREPHRIDNLGMKTVTPSRPGGRVLVIGAVVVIAAVVIAAVLAGSRTVEFEAGSPEEAAQTFIQALFDDDEDAAYGLLTRELQGECEPEDLSSYFGYGPGVARFDRVAVDGDRVEINVAIDSGYPQDAELMLEQRDGRWLVADGDWPFGRCF